MAAQLRRRAPLSIVLEGRTRQGRGELVRHPDEVAKALQQALLQVDGEREPTLEQRRAVAPDHSLVRITLDRP